MRRIVSWMILALLLVGTYALAFNVGLVRAQSETVYINADGSITPAGAPIATSYNITYTLTGNISYPTYNGIVVERNNIVIDGNGYTVQGSYNGTAYYETIGFTLTNTRNVTIEDADIQGFYNGIGLTDSSNNTVSGDNLTANSYGIYLESSNSNVISGNNVTANSYYAIELDSSSNNIVSGNSATANGNGIVFFSSSNNVVSGNNLAANLYCSVSLTESSNNTVSGNNATANSDGDGIELLSSSNNNTVSGNYITANSDYGIDLYSSSNNTVYHNNFVGNNNQVFSDGSPNIWDDGYPSGGNYWSNYDGTDLKSGPYQNVTGSDGIGDTPYIFDAILTDHYPLMGAFSEFSVAAGVDVQVVSNSTVSDFQFNGTAILFNVSGVNGTTGFCNVCIPTSLLNGTLSVFVNGTQVSYSLLPSSNSGLSYLYFTYGYSTEQVVIVPEFPDSLILAMFMLATLLTIAIHKKRQDRSYRAPFVRYK